MQDEQKRAWEEQQRAAEEQRLAEEKKTSAATEKVNQNSQVGETWKTEQWIRDYDEAFDEEGKPRDPDRVDIIALAEGRTLRAQKEGKSRGMSQAKR